MFKFRKYQSDCVAACMLYINGSSKEPGIVVAPTSAGKSWIIAGIAKLHKGPIIVLQPSVELLKQNVSKFRAMGGEASIYSASAGEKSISHVTYGTIGSIKKATAEIRALGDVLLITDECHHGVSPEPGSQFSKFIREIKPFKSIGLTATPFRLSNSMAGSQLKMLNRTRPRYYSHFIYVLQIKEVIDFGFWSPSVNLTWDYDGSALRRNSSGADFTDASIVLSNKHNNVNNNVYLKIQELHSEGKRKHIIVFCDSVATVKKFVEVVPNSAYVTGDMPKKERAKVIEDFKSGRVKVVFNYGTLTTGFDFPELDTIICARPLGSMAQFYQIYGRGCRIHPDKKDFLFVDPCGNFKKLGHPSTLSIENCPYNGWSVFATDRLMTGVILSESMIITRDDLKNRSKMKIEDPGVFNFGKFKNREILTVARNNPGYLQWLIDNTDTEKYGSKRKNMLIGVLKYVQLNK